MSLDPVHIFLEMPLIVKAVSIVLMVQAVLCLAVLIDRLVILTRSKSRSRAFAEDAHAKLDRGDFEGALRVASETSGSHLASYMYTGIRCFLDNRALGISPEKSAWLTERALERHGEDVSESLNRGMNVLASTGSTAPFIGLLGTVLGILFTFQKIAQEGGGGISTIGGEIGEALVVTGLGLLVAIPAVLVFNWLANKIGSFEAGLSNAAGELVDRLEAGEEERRADEVVDAAE